jgi:hypothetical protein
MAKGYFIIDVNEDGEAHITSFASDVDVKRHLDQYVAETGREVEFARDAPFDVNDLGGKALLIKGEIVVPQPVKVATAYKIP